MKMFVYKLKSNQPFETTDKKFVTLSYSKELEDAVMSGDSKRISAIKLTTQDGQKLAYGKLLKSKEFGGGTAGSGGGASSTKTGESAQCVYLQAIYNNPKTDFNKEELKYAYTQVEVDETLGQLLVSEGFQGIEEISNAKPEDIAKIAAIDEDFDALNPFL